MANQRGEDLRCKCGSCSEVAHFIATPRQPQGAISAKHRLYFSMPHNEFYIKCCRYLGTVKGFKFLSWRSVSKAHWQVSKGVCVVSSDGETNVLCVLACAHMHRTGMCGSVLHGEV